jgi:hypothetical protein
MIRLLSARKHKCKVRYKEEIFHLSFADSSLNATMQPEGLLRK